MTKSRLNGPVVETVKHEAELDAAEGASTAALRSRGWRAAAAESRVAPMPEAIVR
jgi:hypothetical protein